MRSQIDALLELTDEWGRMARPVDWHGDAARAAETGYHRITDAVEHLVAEAGAVRRALLAARDGLADLVPLVDEVEATARSHHCVIDDAGMVIDNGNPPDGDATAEQERAEVRGVLEERIRHILARAGAVDDALTGVLDLARRGEIHDGDARTLTAAVAAGTAQGAPAPEIPGPPPWPRADVGSGEHGSEPWWTRGDDLVLEELIENAVVLADLAGWTHAAAHLRHYLGNTGEDYTVDPDEMIRDLPSLRGRVEETVAASVRQIADEAHRNGTYGQPIPFTRDWQRYLAADDQDWYHAMGGMTYSVTGVVTVQPPATPDDVPTAETDYRVHVYDRYNWDSHNHITVGKIAIDDDIWGALHRAGVARDFDITGSGDVHHHQGPVTREGGVELPAPPDNRNGTRTDPGR